MQTKQIGISFIEILIMLLLIGILGSFAIPRFMYQKTNPCSTFASQCKSLIQDGLYQAIITKIVHQIFFDFDHHVVIIKKFDPTKNDPDKHKNFISTHIKIEIPQDLVFHNFFIQGVDEITSNKTMHTAWFYIMPDGTSQNVIINFDYEQKTSSHKKSLIINPFYSQVSEYDSFQHP